MSQINSKPLGVKVKLDAASASSFKQNILNLSKQVNKQPVSINVSSIDASAALDQFKGKLGEILNSISLETGKTLTFTVGGDIGTVSSDIKDIGTQADGATTKVSSLAGAIAEIASTQKSLQSRTTTMRGILGDTAEASELRAKMVEVNQAYAELQAMQNSKTPEATMQAQINKVSQLQSQMFGLLAATKEWINTHKTNAGVVQENINNQNVGYQQALDFYNKLNTYISKNPRAAGMLQYDQLELMRSQLDGLLSSAKANKAGFIELSKVDFSNMISNFRLWTGEIKEAGKEGNTLSGILGSAYKKFGTWTLVTRTFMLLVRQIKKAVTAVKEIDAAMTELKKVTNETDSTYNKFLQNASSRAKEVGASVKDIVSATADFSRLGYSIEDASALADTAIIYKNIGDGIEDISEASDSIVSTMQAFGIEASSAMSIVDKFNIVGNNYAISSAGIGVALQKSAAAMHAANNTLDETIALAAAANTVVQNPEVVGTTLKTVSMYLRAAKTDAEAAGESTDGMAESVSELRSELLALTGNKVDIQIDDETFKSTYQILKELSQVWGELSDVSQANITELIGGKRNANVISALLDNFSVAEEALKTSANSAGSALAENEKHLESIAGHTAKFTAAFETLSENLIGDDTIKFVVDLGTAMINILNIVARLVSALGGLRTIVTTVVAMLAVSRFQAIVAFLSKIPTMILAAGKAVVKFGGYLTGTTSLLQVFRTTFRQTFDAALVDGAGKFKAFTTGVTSGFSQMIASASAAQIATSAIFAGLAIGLGVYNSIKRAQEEAISSANEAIDKYSEVKNTHQSNIDTLNNLRDEFNKLSNGVDQSGNKVSLTTESYNRFLEIIDQIVDISPDVCDGIDSEGRAILDYKSALDQAIQSQNSFLENERNIYLSSGSDIFKGTKVQWNQAINDMYDVGMEIDRFRGFDLNGIVDAGQFNKDLESALKSIDVINSQYGDFISGIVHASMYADKGQNGTMFAKIFQKDSLAIAIYENYDAIVNFMSAIKGANGELVYTSEQMAQLESIFISAAGAYSQFNNVISQQSDYLFENSKNSSWFDKIPIAAFGAFKDAIEDTVDTTAGLGENIALVESLGKDFSNLVDKDEVNSLEELANGVTNLTVSYDTFKEARDAFAAQNAESAALGYVLNYLDSLVAGYEDVTMTAEEAAAAQYKALTTSVYDGMGAMIERVNSLTDAYDKLSNGTLELSDVLALLEKFPELAEYVDITAENFGDLDKGLRKAINSSPDSLIKTLKDFADTRDLTEEQEEAIQSLVDTLEDIPSDAISDLGGDFGLLKDAIDGSRQALSDLEKALSGPDYDNEYDKYTKHFEQLQEVFKNKEFGSKAYKELTAAFGIGGLSIDEQKQWIELNKKYYQEGADGAKNFCKSIEALNDEYERTGGMSGLDPDVLSYDSDAGLFNVDIDRLEEAAKATGQNQDVLMALINKIRMYIKDWGQAPLDTLDELVGSGAAVETENGYIVKLKEAESYLGQTSDEVASTVADINASLATLDVPDEFIQELQELGDGGNVNLLSRPVIDAAELITAGWDGVNPDDLATVFSSTYGNEDGTIAINFTPIMVDEDGNYTGVMSPEALESYAMGVINGVHDDYLGLQIGSEFNGEDAIAQAEEAGRRISEIHADSLNMPVSIVDDSALKNWNGFSDTLEKSENDIKLLRNALELLGIDVSNFTTPDELNTFLQSEEGSTMITTLLQQLGWTETEVDTLIGKFETLNNLISGTPSERDKYRRGGRGDITSGSESAEEISNVDVNVHLDFNGQEVEAVIKTTTDQLDAAFGESNWKASVDSSDLTLAKDESGKLIGFLESIPPETPVGVLDNGLSDANTNAKNLLNYLYTISNTDYTVTITYEEAPLPHKATGTRHAQNGPALLGDEFSPSGRPKPELVVSGGEAYLAGVNGPTIGALKEGDVVYTYDETKKILGNKPFSDKIPAFGGGTYGGTTPWGSESETWGGGSGNYGSSKSGGSSFEDLYKYHKHLIEMDQETIEEFLKWLDEAYQKAYKNGEIELDDFYKYQEEVYQGLKDLFDDYLSDIDHEISILEASVGNSDEIILLAIKAMEEIEKKLAEARAAGLDENGDYIQGLEEQWLNYSETVKDLRESAEEASKDSIDDLVEYRIDMIKKELEEQKDALSEELDAIHDFYDEQRDLLQEQRDEEKYLDEQAEKRKSVADIQAELARLEFDNSAWAQKRKLELQEELADAQKELDDFEKDHAYDKVIDTLDEQEAAEEARIQAEIDAIDAKLNDPQALFNQALADIKNNTQALFEAFLEYNRKYGSGDDRDIIEMWEEAYKKDQEYQDTHDGEHYDDIEIGNYTDYETPKPDPDAPFDPPPNTDPEPSTTKPEYPPVSGVSGTLKQGSKGDDVKSLQYALNELGYGNSGTESIDGVFGAQTAAAVKAYQKARGLYVDGVVGAKTKSSFGNDGYASGTTNATAGLHRVNELGPEYLFTSPSDGSRYRLFTGGEKVLNADATDFLYNFATSRGSMLSENISRLIKDTFGGLVRGLTGQAPLPTITTGNIIIQGNADEHTVSEIRRAQRDQVSFILKEFGRLRK